MHYSLVCLSDVHALCSVCSTSGVVVMLLLNCTVRCNEMVFNSHICFYFKLILKVNTKEGLGEEIKIIYLFLDVECENYALEYSHVQSTYFLCVCFISVSVCFNVFSRGGEKHSV